MRNVRRWRNNQLKFAKRNPKDVDLPSYNQSPMGLESIDGKSSSRGQSITSQQIEQIKKCLPEPHYCGKAKMYNSQSQVNSSSR